MKVTIEIDGKPSEVAALIAEISRQPVVTKNQVETVVFDTMDELKRLATMDPI